MGSGVGIGVETTVGVVELVLTVVAVGVGEVIEVIVVDGGRSMGKVIGETVVAEPELAVVEVGSGSVTEVIVVDGGTSMGKLIGRVAATMGTEVGIGFGGAGGVRATAVGTVGITTEGVAIAFDEEVGPRVGRLDMTTPLPLGAGVTDKGATGGSEATIPAGEIGVKALLVGFAKGEGESVGTTCPGAGAGITALDSPLEGKFRDRELEERNPLESTETVLEEKSEEAELRTVGKEGVENAKFSIPTAFFITADKIFSGAWMAEARMASGV